MSGGRLVVVDRSGRDKKSYPLPSGVARIGRAAGCHIRVLQAAIRPHHATLLVRSAQTVIRDESSGATLVNGQPVSVAALRHGDLVTVGDRTLRWEYDMPQGRGQLERPPPVLARASSRRSGASGAPGRRSEPAAPPLRPDHIAQDIEMRHRASMPASAGGKQVAIVQPQRRELQDTSASEPSEPPTSPRGARARAAKSESELAASKAELWIESRKSGKQSAPTPKSAPVTPKQATPKQNTPRKASPRKSTNDSTPRETAPRKSTNDSRETAPRKSAKQTTPKETALQSTPRQVSPRKSTSKNTPKEITPTHTTRKSPNKKVTPKQNTPKTTPKQPAPKQDTPKPTPKRATPKQTTPNRSTQSRVSPKTPKLSLPLSTKRVSPRSVTPKALPRSVTPRTLPRASKKATPLRLTVLRKAQSAIKNKVMKIEDPTRIDHTKQAAIMRMTGHTRALAPSLLLKRPSPVNHRKSGPPPKKSKSPRGRSSTTISPRRNTQQGQGDAISVFEITDTSVSQYSRPSSSRSRLSPLLPSPKKSALKDPKNTTRKTESIKFDLSNLESFHDILSDADDATRGFTTIDTNASGDNTMLRYSESVTLSKSPTPSPRRSIHSRSSKILEQVGSPLKLTQSPRSRSQMSPSLVAANTSTPINMPKSPRSRSSVLVQKALATSPDNSRLSRKSRNTTNQSVTKSVVNQTWNTTAESAFKTRTFSPRNMEAYSVVDLVSMDSDNTETASYNSQSLYDSLGTTRSSSIAFGTPQGGRSGRTTRSTIGGDALTSSTPYVDKRKGKSRRSNSSPNVTKASSPKASTRRSQSMTTPDTIGYVSVNSTKVSRVSRSRSGINDTELQFVDDKSRRSNSSPNITKRTSSPKTSSSRRSQSLTTPENTGHVSINSTRVSRVSKSRSRINDTELQFLDDTVDESPKSSRKSKPSKPNSPNVTANKSSRRKLTVNISLASSQGTVTPENQNSPEEQGTPMLSIQSLLNSSRSSFSQYSQNNRTSPNVKRKTVGVLRSPRQDQSSPRSKSFTAASRSLRALRLNRPSNSSDKESTPTSAVKLIQEAVKNKHSTAKKPQSKRSIIDDLNESDIVKQLFNSPVKRKLSQSMTEMSRKHLFDDEEVPKRTRYTIHLTGRSPTNDSVLDRSEQFTPEDFVSPLNTPVNSPNLSRVKRLFNKNTPDNNLHTSRGARSLLSSPTRKSVTNDPTNISGVHDMITTSPMNRKSSTIVARTSTPTPKIVRETKKGRSPKNDLTNISGVRDLFKRKSVKNDLRRVSGVKRALAKSPNNDLRDVRGVKHMFGNQHANDYSDLSGVEELFDQSHSSQTTQPSQRDPERLFDQLLGKPPIKAVYSKSFIGGNKPKKLQRRSLRKSIEIITNNVEEWLQQELNKSIHKKPSSQGNTSQSRVTKELQKLATDTVEGNEIRNSRVRNSTANTSLAQESIRRSKLAYSARKLPIKKRSFVEASLENSGNSDTSQRGSSLPIKKRLVVHSTPVRGTYNVTMNATEIRAVSPIAVVNVTRMNYSARSPNRQTVQSPRSPKHVSPKKLASPKQIASPKQTKRRGTKQNITETMNDLIEAQSLPAKRRRNTKTKASNEVTAVVASPKPKRTTRGKIATVVSPKRKTTDNQPEVQPSPKPRGRRGKTQNVKQSPVQPESKKRTKKASENVPTPIPSPKPKRGRNQTGKSISETIKPSPKKTRGKAKASPVKATTSRGKTSETNTKRGRNSLVITKKPPVLGPKRAQKAQEVVEKPETPKKTTRRQNASPKKVTPVKTPKQTRAKLVIPKPSPQMKPQGSRRGKKPLTPKTTPKKATPKVQKATKKPTQLSPVKSPEKPATKRGRRNANVEVAAEKIAAKSANKPASPKTKRGTKAAPQKSATPTKTGTSKRGTKSQHSTEPSPKRGRKVNATETIKSPAKRGRKANVTENVKSSPKPQRGGRKANVTENVESPPKAKRGRKANVTEPVKSPPKPMSPQKGRKRKAVADEAAVPAKVAKQSPAPKGRGRKQDKLDTPKGRSRSTAKQTKVTPKSAKKQEPTLQVKSKAKTVKTPAKTRGGKAKSPVKAAKAAKSPVKGAKVAKSPVKGAKAATKAAKLPAKGAKAKAVKSPAKKTTRSRKR